MKVATPAVTEWVPAEPFARWLNMRLAYWEQLYPGRAQTEVVREVGWDKFTVAAGLRMLFRMRHQRFESTRGRKKGVSRGVGVLGRAERFKRAVVEDALFHAGVPFADVYPEIAAAEDLELESEAWCPGCRESRTPINGLCPFCEWRIGPATGQVLQGRKMRGRVAA